MALHQNPKVLPFTPGTTLDGELEPKLSPLLKEIERAFGFFNKELFAGQLSQPVFAFHPQTPNGHRLGHYHPSQWNLHDDARFTAALHPEIVFYSDLCLAAGMEQVLETLVHEMVHHWQQLFGQPSANNHHNKAWHDKARACGLITKYGQRPAGPRGESSAGPAFEALVHRFSPRLDGIPFRPHGAKQRKKGKMAKWVCQCTPQYSVYVGKGDVSIRCCDCGMLFRKA